MHMYEQGKHDDAVAPEEEQELSQRDDDEQRGSS